MDKQGARVSSSVKVAATVGGIVGVAALEHDLAGTADEIDA